jgi:hypothetical protein
MDWLPEFALKHSEIQNISSGELMSLVRRAAKRVYESATFENRGEFGELFLHAAIRQVFDSQPAVSKVVYKSARNETVKGFDAVHVVDGPNGPELWLGEAKFYEDVAAAIRTVVKELDAHTQTDYLRDEFLLIRGKVDPAWPRAAEFEAMISENRSLDDVFKKACIAVLLTYDSDCLSRHTECSEEYRSEFIEEIMKHHANFAGRNLPPDLSIHLILLPLFTKQILLAELDNKLRALQTL